MSLVYKNSEHLTEQFRRSLPASIQERQGYNIQEPAEMTVSIGEQPPATITIDNSATLAYETTITVSTGEYQTLHNADAFNELIDAVEEIELSTPEAPVVKRRRVVKKKNKPLFWKEETVGERTTIPALLGQFAANLQQDHVYERSSSKIDASSPFVKLIPLKLLTNCFDINSRNWTMYSPNTRARVYERNLDDYVEVRKACEITDQNTGISQMVNAMIHSGNMSNFHTTGFSRQLNEHLNYFIKDRNAVNLSQVTDSGSSFDFTERAFLTGEAMKLDGRTFSVSLGSLTCFLETERYSRVYTPQVMAIILPENYVYQKQHVLLHGTIDLSKVVVLVNRELDDADFHHKNFRAYYRKHILPILNTLKVDIWKVPVSFMEENCFHGDITLEKTSFMEKKKEIEDIYENFRNTYSFINLDPEEDSDDDDYDEEEYDDDDD